MTDRTSGPTRRRRHAATGGRVLAGGLSAAAALGLVGAMAHAAPGTATSTGASAPAPAAPTVIVVRRPAGTAAALPAAPPVTPTTAAPVAASGAS